MRTFATLLLIGAFITGLPAAAQVIESSPNPARTDQSVTITFHADRGNEGLKDCDCDVYAHTGLITSKSGSDSDWQYVKNHWPTSSSFGGNRSDTRLTEVGPNTYELQISDIRSYYSKNNTGAGDVPPKSEEEIEKMAFVFRNADGSNEGKTSSGGDLYVEVSDVGTGDPFVSASILSPESEPPLYPFMTASDTTVSVTVKADTANVDSLKELRLSVDGSQVASTKADSLTYDLSMTSPNRFQMKAEAVAADSDSSLSDSASTELIRTPNVVDEPRPSGVEDGINYHADDSKVTLSLYAPNKEFVYAIGDFTNWAIDDNYFLKRHKVAPDSVHWWITIDGLTAQKEYDFQYFVDGEIRMGDPFSEKVRSPQDQYINDGYTVYPNLKSYPGSETENLVSVLETGQQSFNFSPFTPPEREELVIYELLLRDFLEQHSFQALTDTLDYLDRLGVNAVELMPVANFGGNNSWGYNPNFHLALDKSYGPEEDLKQFVEAAHQRGIAVILDVVYNHATGQSPLVQLYGSSDTSPFINNPASTQFSVFNQLDHSNPYIKYWLDRANEHWLQEFNVDGFRFDLAKGFVGRNGDSQDRIDNLTRMADHIWSVDPDAHVILELFASNSEEQTLAQYRNGDTGGMMMWNNVNRPYSQSSIGFLDDPSFSSDLSASYYENRGFTTPNLITYMESHDEQWLMRRNKEFGKSSSGGSYDITELETALNRQKLVGAFFFTVPGPRMMWQFGELGYGYGSNECLKPGGGGDGECDPSDPGRTAPKPVRWDYFDTSQHPDRVRLYDAWSALISLRNKNEVFTSTSTNVSMRVGQSEFGRRIVLQHDSMNAVVIGNFDVQSRSVNPKFPSAGTWYDYFTGTEINIESGETTTPVPLAPGEFHIYTSEKVAFPDSGLVPFESAAPPPKAPTSVNIQGSNGEFTLSWTASASSDVIRYDLYRATVAQFDTSGKKVAHVSAGTTSYTDTSATKTGTTYHYRIVAVDNEGERSPLTDPAKGLLYPDVMSVDVSRSFEGSSKQEDYRLVALPGQVDRALSQTLSGPAGKAWQAYWDDGSESNFLLQHDGSSTFAFRPGRGFWLISDSSWAVEDQISTVALKNGNVTSIDLHSGWNIISNPFDRDVRWSNAAAINGGQLQPLWDFDGNFSQVSTFASAEAGEAFYFLNDTGLDKLTIPYGTDGAIAEAPKTAYATASDLTTLTLTVSRDGEESSSVRAGWSKTAEVGRDALDWVAPPGRFSSLTLRARTTGQPSMRQKWLARSVLPRNDMGQKFSLVLHSDRRAPATISVKNGSAFTDQEVRLVNEATGTSFDLHEQKTVTLRSPTQDTPLTLLIGSHSYVTEEQNRLTAARLTLESRPNPFHQRTNLAYTVPEPGKVTLEVFDILGRQVRVLVDERKRAGTYTISWGGGDHSGKAVASGVYLGRLTFENKTITQKMVLVK